MEINYYHLLILLLLVLIYNNKRTSSKKIIRETNINVKKNKPEKNQLQLEKEIKNDTSLNNSQDFLLSIGNEITKAQIRLGQYIKNMMMF